MKKLFIFLPFVLFLVMGCQNKQAQVELDELKAVAELESQNIAVVQKYIDAWNSKDLQVIDDLTDPDFKLYLPSTNPNPMTTKQMKEWMGMLYQAFPDIHYDIREIFADGDRVSVWWVCSCTHEGDYLGILATGMKIDGSAIEIYQVQNGKIIAERGETDAAGFYQQLGLSFK